MVYGAGNGGGAQLVRVQSQNIGRGQASFDVYDPDGSVNIQLGQTVLIMEGRYRYFAGCVSEIALDLFEGPGFPYMVVWHVQANDKAGIFDHRVVLTQTIPAGTDGADAIRDLFNSTVACNPPLSAEGITLNNVPASLGALTSDIVINLWTVSKVLDTICDQLDCTWFVDTTNDLHVQAADDLVTAPFSISTLSNNFRKAQMKSTLLEYRTKQYALSDQNIVPSATSQGPSGIATTETWTLPQQAAEDRGFLFGSVITNFMMLQVTSLKVNGVAQPIHLGTELINFRHSWWYFPNTPYLIPPNAANTNPFPLPPVLSPDPIAGDVIEISYIAPQQQARVQTGDPLEPATGTCGSGVYEAVEQVKGITDQTDLDNIAAAILARRGGIPKTLSFETDKPGLQVGMSLPVDIPRLDLASTSLVITSMDGTAQEGKLEYGSVFRWKVQASNIPDLGNPDKWVERLVRRTENGTPISRYEEATFILAPGGASLTTGVVDSNDYIIKNTGRVFLMYASASNNPPQDQDLQIEILSQQQGIIGQVTIPAGSTALAQQTVFVQPDPFYLYKDDVLTASVAYVVTGADPVNASNVTLGLRIAY